MTLLNQTIDTDRQRITGQVVGGMPVEAEFDDRGSLQWLSLGDTFVEYHPDIPEHRVSAACIYVLLEQKINLLQLAENLEEEYKDALEEDTREARDESILGLSAHHLFGGFR